MTIGTKCINVFGGSMAPQIDFVVVVYTRDFDVAVDIVDDAEEEWFDEDASSTIAEFISERLTNCNIEHEIYFKDSSDEDEV